MSDRPNCFLTPNCFFAGEKAGRTLKFQVFVAMRLDPTYMFSLLLLPTISTSAPLDARPDTPNYTNLHNYAVAEQTPMVHALVTRAHELIPVHMKFLWHADGWTTYRGYRAIVWTKTFQEWQHNHLIVTQFQNDLQEGMENEELMIKFWGEGIPGCKDESEGCYIKTERAVNLLGAREIFQHAQFWKGNELLHDKLLTFDE
ncbi:hypothetical protein EV361DRAFT_950442 [Lentinula raphanica]|nr:hypothetical protein EV361DRAFT_950442 [Lentinula raphanica]